MQELNEVSIVVITNNMFTNVTVVLQGGKVTGRDHTIDPRLGCLTINALFTLHLDSDTVILNRTQISH